MTASTDNDGQGLPEHTPEEQNPADHPSRQRYLERRREQHEKLRLEREAYEREYLGSDIPHVGHCFAFVSFIEGWVFRKCSCGATLALSATGKLYWIRSADAAKELKSFDELLYVLSRNCQAHRADRNGAWLGSSPEEKGQETTPQPPRFPEPNRKDGDHSAATTPPAVAKAPVQPVAVVKQVPNPKPVSAPATAVLGSKPKDPAPPPPTAKSLKVYYPSTPRGGKAGRDIRSPGRDARSFATAGFSSR